MAFPQLRLRTIIPATVIGIFLPIGMVIIGLIYSESLSDLEKKSERDFARQLTELSLDLDRVDEDASRNEAQRLLSSAGAGEGIVHISLVGKDGKIIASTHFDWIGKPIGSVWDQFDPHVFQGLFQGSTLKIFPHKSGAGFTGYHFTKLREHSDKYIRSTIQGALVGVYDYSRTRMALEKRLRDKAALYLVALLCSAGLITFLLIRLISIPIERLGDFVASLDRTSFDKEVDPSGTSEVRSLGAAINSMSRALRVYHENIEEEIRERKSAEFVLQRFRSALDSSADAVYVINPETMMFIDMNRTAYESLGYTRDELLSMGPHEIKPLLTRGELANTFAVLTEHAGTQKFETLHTRKDGSQFTVEVLLRGMKDDTQAPIVIASVRDIDQRKANEETLRKLSQAIQQAGEAVMITDRNALIEYVNPAFTEITGYQPEDIIGKTPAVLKSSAQEPSFYKDLWDTIAGGRIWHGTLIDKKKDGSFYPALMSVAPIHNESGEITHYVSIQQDMTDYKKMEEQFLQAQKMEAIGTLVGGIAHDFNNMLAAIQGNVYLARREFGNQTKLDDRMDNIEQLGTHAADMVKQLLTFARKDRVRMNTLSLNAFIKEVFKLVRSTVPENIELVCDPCEEELIIDGDATQLQQVLMNLLNNARDAISHVPQPKISCSLRPFVATADFKKAHPEIKGERFAVLNVSDNGEGIEEAHLQKVFEPFFTTKRVGEGTGLGLAMVYGAVQSHRGTIEVESEQGKGTAFHMYLPLIDGAGNALQEKDRSIIQGQGETILLVDDEDSMRSTTEEVLLSLGYKVLSAADGEQALEMFAARQHDISLVITDVVMPKMGGVDLAKAVRLLNKKVPIIFATGYAKDQVMTAGDQVEKSTTISKPFAFDQLSQLLRKLMASD